MLTRFVFIAVLTLVLWVSWLARYEVQPPTDRSVIFMLDRWTGTVYVSFQDDGWREIKHGHGKYSTAPVPQKSAESPGKDDWIVPAEPPVMRSWDPAAPKDPWEEDAPKGKPVTDPKLLKQLEGSTGGWETAPATAPASPTAPPAWAKP